MNLIVDIGNSRAKVALFTNNELLTCNYYTQLLVGDMEEIFQKHAAIRHCIVSNSGYADALLMHFLRQKFPNLVELSGNSKLPFNNQYQSKETQGTDRIAAIAGAQYLFPQTNLLIIDAGTAITFDFIDASSNYAGGNISPGIEMRFKALHQFTHKLPLVEQSAATDFMGLNTHQAMLAGVQNGIVYECEGYIVTFSGTYPSLKTIITGGDADFFANKLKSAIFVEPNLVLTGLNRILNYNV